MLNDLILSNSSASLSANGSAIDASFIIYGSCQVVATGAPAGTVKVQASNDKPLAYNLMETFTPTNWSDVSGLTVNVTTSGAYLIPKFDVSYQWIRAVYTSTATGAQTITTVADVAGSLNSKYFLLNSANAGVAYYVWLNVDSGGVDPMVAGRTGVPVAISASDTANTIATAVASAIDGLATFVAPAPGANVITVTNSASGPFTPASDFNTGFTFAVTTGSGTVAVNFKSVGA